MTKINEIDIVFQLSKKFQDNCHAAVEAMMKDNPKVTYQDATNVWLFKKLAELELKLYLSEHPEMTLLMKDNYSPVL